MDLTWNLNSIYPSFDSDEFKSDMDKLQKYIDVINQQDINSWENNKNSLFKIENFLKLINEYKDIYTKLSSYAYLVMNSDTENIKAANAYEDIENVNSGLTEINVKFIRWLKSIKGLDEIVHESLYLKEHNFYLHELLLKSKYLLSEKEELIISKMQNTGARSWEKFYMELISDKTAEIIVDGETKSLTLSELRNIAYEKDSLLRKEAYYKEASLCKEMSIVSSKCINGISGEALTIYTAKGYKSPLHKVLTESRMSYETLNIMMSAIKESLPMFQKYFLKKAKLLGHKKELPFYDMYAPIKGSNKKVTYMEAQDIIVTSFSSFSKNLASFAKKAFESRWIDALPRKGKGNFGLSVDIFPLKESRIMTNFDGNHIDISILAHEIGHAYHSSKLYNETMLNTDYPTPIAETASIFCETLVNNELIKKLPNEEVLTILERTLSDAAYYIVDFYGRYLFENELYERRKHGSLSCEELNELMTRCMKNCYGEGIDAKTLHPYMWMNKVGYFMTGNEYLNFPYSFGLLFSKGLYSEYLKRGQDFVSLYDKFLSETSKNNIAEAAKIINIDVNSIDFWKGSLQLIEKDIEKFILC